MLSRGSWVVNTVKEVASPLTTRRTGLDAVGLTEPVAGEVEDGLLVPLCPPGVLDPELLGDDDPDPEVPVEGLLGLLEELLGLPEELLGLPEEPAEPPGDDPLPL
jgi:hypothetical protein